MSYHEHEPDPDELHPQGVAPDPEIRPIPEPPKENGRNRVVVAGGAMVAIVVAVVAWRALANEGAAEAPGGVEPAAGAMQEAARAREAESAALDEADRARASLRAATADRAEAVAARESATEEAGRLRRELELRRREARDANELAAFVGSLYDVAEFESDGVGVDARRLLDRGAARLGDAYEDRPDLRARMLGTLGTSYARLGVGEAARGHLTAALGEFERAGDAPSLEVAELLLVLGDVEAGEERFGDALRAYDRAAELQAAELGEEHPATATTRAHRSAALVARGDVDAGVAGLRDAVPILEAAGGAGALDLAWVHTRLARALGEKAPAESTTHLERALELLEDVRGPEDVTVAEACFELGSAYARDERYSEAARTLERAVTLLERTLEPEHPRTGIAYLALARVVGDFDRAGPLFLKGLAVRDASSPDDPTVVDDYLEIGQLFQGHGDVDEAERLYRRALVLCDGRLESGDPRTPRAVERLAVLLRNESEYEEALGLYDRLVTLREKMLRQDDPLVPDAIFAMAGIHRVSRRPAEAAVQYERALERYDRSSYGPEHPVTLECLRLLVDSLEWAGDDDALERVLSTAISRFESARPEDAEVFDLRGRLGLLQFRRGRSEEARDVILTALEQDQATGGAHRLRVQLYYADVEIGTGRLEEALDIAERACRELEVTDGSKELLATALGVYGSTLSALRRESEAFDAFERALNLLKSVGGDPLSATRRGVRRRYVEALRAAGRRAEAAKLEETQRVGG